MKSNILIAFAFLVFLSSCSNKELSNGTYCADVMRYNPKTGKESSYTLTVEISNGKLVQMDYPNGGHSDSGDFKPPTVKNSSVSFSDFNGANFSVDITEKGTDCFETNKLSQCAAYTKKGSRCKNKTPNKSGKCWKHD